MIVLDCVQGSPEWERARLGKPTASAYDRIITPSTLKLSKQAVGYRNQLLAEFILDCPIDWCGQDGWMERGKEMEPEARAYYAMQFDREVTPVGFVLRDDERTGGSPDGLVDEDGGLEIKCPAIHTHIGYMLNPESLAAAYRGQMQGYLYLTGRAWWDILSYNPELPHVCVRVERDEAYIEALDKALNEFLDDLYACREKLAPHREARATLEMAGAA